MRTEQKMDQVCFKIGFVEGTCTADRGCKSKLSLQDVLKQSTVSSACPSAETYTASVVRSGIEH